MDYSIRAFVLKGFIVCIAFSLALIILLRVLKIRTPKYVYVALLALLLTWDNIYANVALYYFGTKEGGEYIYKVVENVDGYYDESCELGCAGNCVERLETHKYEFIECNVAPPKYLSPVIQPRRFLVERLGLHRFSLVEKGSPLCKLYYENYPKKRDEPYCIASERVDKLKSRYSYHELGFEDFVPFITKRTSVVKDMKTGEVIARATNFHNHAGWLNYLIDKTSTVARYPKDTSIQYKVLYDTLKSSKGNQ